MDKVFWVIFGALGEVLQEGELFMFEIKKPITALELKMLCDIASKGETAFRLQEVEKCWPGEPRSLNKCDFYINTRYSCTIT